MHDKVGEDSESWRGAFSHAPTAGLLGRPPL